MQLYNRQKRRQSARAIWLKYHLYLALSAGFFFALSGLTGSLNIYRDTFDELLNPQLIIEKPQGTYLPLDRIMAAVQKAHPSRHGAWTLEMPRTRHGTITAWFDTPYETAQQYYAPLMVAVNPYTAEIVTSRLWGGTFTTWILDLHTQLHLGGFGWKLVGILGVLLSVSVVSGLYLWWPGLKKLRQALIIRHDTGLKIMALDIHRLLGLSCAGGLLVLAFTGVHLSYPALLETLTASSGMGHGDEGPEVRSTAQPNPHPVNLAAAAMVARGLFPHSELRRITTPVGDTGSYRINLRQSSEINQQHPFTTVWVDRWSGQILEVRNPNNFSQGAIFTTWLWPIHTGEALGAWGRFLWFIIGIGIFVLYVSGLLHWLLRHDLLRDREVNFAPLQAIFTRLKNTIYRLGLVLLGIVYWLFKKAAAYARNITREKAPLAGLLTRMRVFMQIRNNHDGN